MKNEIEKIVEESVKEILCTSKKESVDMFSSTFFGSDGFLDSIGLVSLITILEEKIQDNFDLFISLANEKALSSYSSPFKNFDSLVQYIENVISIETANG